MANTHRNHKELTRMYVFDLDGVVTDPETGDINQDVLMHIVRDLQAGRAVAFNTGRPVEWVIEEILHYITTHCTPKELENLLVVCEMGGVLCSFNNGRERIELDSAFSLPGRFIQDVQQVLDVEQAGGWRIADYMEWDGLKKTMGTLMKWNHVSIADFDRARPVVESILKELLATHGLKDFIINQTITATDIQHKTAGKHKGAEQVMAWLKENRVRPKTFYAFGDNPSDKAMAEMLATTGTPTTFVFVGNPKQGSDVQNPAYKTVVTGGHYSRAAAEYLLQAG